jgi:hypothetical protein
MLFIALAVLASLAYLLFIKEKPDQAPAIAGTSHGN